MTGDHEEAPLSPLDAEIETLLDRLTALQARTPAPDEAPVLEVAIQAIRDRLQRLSRKCTDKTCRIRTLEQIREVTYGGGGNM